MNSNEEIELKFFVNSELSSDAVVALVDQNLSDYDLLKLPRRKLGSTYYDTPDLLLRNHRVGFRVRTDGQSFEETVKTGSRTGGGLHSRTEHNIPLDTDHPDLKRVPGEFWEQTGIDQSRLNQELKPLFVTDFCRIRRKVMKEGRVIAEFCFDSGRITAGDRFELIGEIELELVDGTVAELLQLARKMVDNAALKLHLDSRSKAQRGFELAGLSVPPSAKSFLLLDGEPEVLVRAYFDMYLEHEQILLSRFDLRSLSVMTLAAYQLQKLTNDSRFNLLIPALLELERMVADSEGRHKKFIRLISSRSYLVFILDSYAKIYCGVTL
ncbi:MAG: CYTH domain-containing protein [Succinivibrionaceae bacterium]|nr:CYTH domain-containing protein [Succinivibrionaceae bacterium]